MHVTFRLTEEQQLLRDSAARFAREKLPLAALRRLRDSHDATGYDRTAWAEMAQMGWAGILIPEEHGGVGAGMAGAALIAEELGRTLAASPMLSTAILGVTALLRAGSRAQQAQLLPPIAAGDLTLALALEETPRHDPHRIDTRATPSGDGYSLTGVKRFVLDGHVADRLIISAHVEGGSGSTLFVVERARAGVKVERTVMVDSRNAARVSFLQLKVSAADILGKVGESGGAIDAMLGAGRAFVAAEMVGIASEAFERTLDYLKQRTQFGRRIGEFQAIQHRAAQLFCELELARSAVAAAVRALDAQDESASLLVAAAKAKAGEVARLATNEAVQLHGGIGMTDEFDIGLFMKRARAAAETFGDYNFQANVVASRYGF